MEPKEDIKKIPIDKKPLAEKPKAEIHKEDKREESIELPISKIIIGLAILLVIAAIVVGISPIGGKSNEWGVSQIQVKIVNIFKSGAAADGGVAAYVNGQAITCGEIDKKYASVPDSMKTYITKDVLLNQTINEMVIRQAVTKRGIQLDDAYVQAMINNVKSQFPDEKSFNDTLVQQGITYAEVVDQLTLSLKLNKMLQQDMPELRVNESEIEAFFAQNKGNLSVPEQVRASHILVNSSETADKIEAMLKNGADFAALAKNYSIDTASAVYGGELGYFSRGTMIPAFENAAFNLSVGEISAPVKTQYGYHIIKLTDRKAARPAVLDNETKALIALNLFNNKWDANKDKVNSYIAELRKAANITPPLRTC